MKKNKVFLGGTCNGSIWRDELIPLIQVDHFNPVVKDWTPACIVNEEVEKDEKCNIHLYVITSDMIGVYSIAEVIRSSMTHCKNTILHVIPDGFNKGQLKSLDAVCQMVRLNGSIAYIDSELARTARVINFSYKTSDFS